MNKILIGVAAIALIGSLAYLSSEENKFFPTEEDQMMQRFKEFKQTYGKKYDTAEEDTIRFLIFQENVEKIDSVQSESFSVGVNQFADLTSAEFKQLYTGYAKRTVRGNDIKHLSTVNLPASVDWRSIVNPVKNQGQCGSCWAFSAVAGVEALYALNYNQTLSFSEQQVVDCSKKNDGCNGGDLPPAFDYIIANGLELESTYPYKARDQRCAYKASSVVFAPKSYVEVPSQDNDQLAAAVAQQPTPVCIEADSTVFQYYRSGVLDSAACGTDLDHCVEVVGYTSDAWIVRNSWGTTWGEQGHIRIKKESGKSAGICGIALEAVYPTL